MVDFGGWDMPVQFQGVMAEHLAVREKAGLFDISHMGQVLVKGPAAGAFLQKILTNDLSRLMPGQGQYTLMCQENGCVVDDLYLYCLGKEHYFLIVNASRTAIDLEWMRKRKTGDLDIIPQPQAAGLALQGPDAANILKKIFPALEELKKNQITEFSSMWVSRTGYTGEDGFELFSSADNLLALYPDLLEEGKLFGLQPCGLGARDTLRLEMGYRLYGNDLDEQHTALESGLGWVVKFDKTDFIGKNSLLQEKETGPSRRIIAFRLKARGVPRHGYAIFFNGETIGEVTSGTFSPSLQQGIGLGYVQNALFPKDRQEESGLCIRIHDRDIPAEAVKLPFYRRQ